MQSMLGDSEKRRIGWQVADVRMFAYTYEFDAYEFAPKRKNDG